MRNAKDSAVLQKPIPIVSSIPAPHVALQEQSDQSDTVVR